MEHPVWSISERALHFARAAADRAHARLTGGRCDGPETLLADLGNALRATEAALVAHGTAVRERAFADPGMRGSDQIHVTRRVRDLHGVLVSAAMHLASLACVAAIRGRAGATEAPADDAPARALFEVLQTETLEERCDGVCNSHMANALVARSWTDVTPAAQAMLRRASDAVARVVRAEGTRIDHG